MSHQICQTMVNFVVVLSILKFSRRENKNKMNKWID